MSFMEAFEGWEFWWYNIREDDTYFTNDFEVYVNSLSNYELLKELESWAVFDNK